MTNQEIQKLLDDGVALLKQTSVGYANHGTAWQNNTSTKWWQGLDKIAQGRKALDATPPPPPPPPTGATAKPYILFRYGPSFKDGNPATYGQHYEMVVVGYGDDDKATVVAPAKLLAYRTITDVPSGAASSALSGGGMTDEEARAGGWLLKKADGSEVYDTRWGVYYGDMSSGFTAKWCDTVKARFAQYPGLAGLFFDNTTGRRGDFDGGLNMETKYGSDRGFADAMLSHLRAARAALPGKYLLTNTGNGPGARVDWWKEVAATGVNGLMVETYNGGAEHNGLIQAAQAAGRDAWALVYGDPASSTVKGLHDTFKSVSNGHGGFGVNSGGPDPWNANWTT